MTIDYTHTLHTYWHAHTRACPFTHLCVRKNCAFKDRPRYHPLPRNSLHVPARCHPTTVVLLFARRIDHVPFRSTCLLFFFFSFLFFFLARVRFLSLFIATAAFRQHPLSLLWVRSRVPKGQKRHSIHVQTTRGCKALTYLFVGSLVQLTPTSPLSTSQRNCTGKRTGYLV